MRWESDVRGGERFRPTLEIEDVHAAIAYAAELAHERMVPIPRTA
ncbi:MAG: hypothetical protein ACXWH7_06785 [Thermoanaerobaculia bacterium]